MRGFWRGLNIWKSFIERWARGKPGQWPEQAGLVKLLYTSCKNSLRLGHGQSWLCSYVSWPRNRAYLLTQLRTGHNWLSTYAKKFGFRDDDRCECGAQETVSHVLLECPKLRALRMILRSRVGDALNSVSSLLGGSTEGERGNPDTVSRAKTVEAVLDFAEASQRFRSRAPQGQPNSGSGNGPG